MKIQLKRVNKTVLFEASNARGHKVLVEGGPSLGGEEQAPSPTELLLMSQAACTAIDIVALLQKMRQPLEHLEIESEGHKALDQVPKVFTHIHLHYTIYGNVEPAKAEKAISLSIERYCTVTKMIDKMARVTHTFTIFNSMQTTDEHTPNEMQ